MFLVKELVSSLSELEGSGAAVRAGPDDSHGGDDALIVLQNKVEIGVQVTELTHELHRMRGAIRKRYIAQVLNALERTGVTSPVPVAARLLVAAEPYDRLNVHPDELANAIASGLRSGLGQHIVTLEEGSLLILPVTDGDLYIRHVGNVGFDVDFDQVPFTMETYERAVDYLANKKSESKSPWLLIWSLGFWRDKHAFGIGVIRHMKQAFATSHFDRVYFMESLDSPELFRANLTVTAIKG